MNNQQVKQLDAANVMQTYGRFDVAIEKGQGAVCYDFDGKKYIDFGSGIGVNSLGYCDPQWAAAVAKQAATLNHVSNLFYSAPYAQLAQRLCKAAGMSRVFFANSGAEANEGAIKLARKRSFAKYGEGRHEIVTLLNSFHGRTITTLAATGQDVFHRFFTPFTEGFFYAAAGEMAALRDAVGLGTCAVMLELIQGEGGVLPLERDYVKQVAAFCKEKDLALIVDEVQTGVGRCGSFYAYQQYGVTPNIVSSAKGLGGGLPIGAVLADEEYGEVFAASDHATTFGGNPIACAGALAVMDRVDSNAFLREVVEKGDYIRTRLENMRGVQGTRGLGLMIGADVDAPAKDVAAACIENGLLVLTAKAAVRLLPPLTITYAEIDEGLEILKKVLCQLAG